MANQPTDADTLLRNFAKAYEEVLGTDDTITLIRALTAFAQGNPDAVQDLQAEVAQNGEFFARMLTREGVDEARAAIALFKQFNKPGKSFAGMFK